MTKEQLRQRVRASLPDVVRRVNAALNGQELEPLAPTLERVGRGAQLPHWYERLRTSHDLPNLDGKTIGSVIEMLFLAVLESGPLQDAGPLGISPARGVDFPDLGLSVKSPSTNYCTSEPFFSVYERLTGGDYDAVVLLTDYQQQKKNPPLKLSIVEARYLGQTQIADRKLCSIARKYRPMLLADSEARAQRVFCFLAHVNQSDWRAKRLLILVASLDSEELMSERLDAVEEDYNRQNRVRARKGRELIPVSELEVFHKIRQEGSLRLAVYDALDNWVADVHKEFGRLPNSTEWSKLRDGPLDGAIGMSLALQWRYNFGPLFGVAEESEEIRELEAETLDGATGFEAIE